MTDVPSQENNLQNSNSLSPEQFSQVKRNNSTDRSKKFMFLKLGVNTFALPLSSVCEVMGVGQISNLPNMPVYFAGLINLRGKIVSAVHLKKSLSYLASIEGSDSTIRRPCVIITEVSGRMFGAIVDDVVEVQAVPDGQIDHDVDGLKNREVFEGIIKRTSGDLAPILNLERALRVNELISLSEKSAA